MTKTLHERRWRHAFGAMLILIVVLIGGSLLLHWAWNAFAVELLGARAMAFRHAAAAETLVAVIGATLVLTARIFGGASYRRALPDGTSAS